MDQQLKQDLISSTNWNDLLEKSVSNLNLITKEELDRIKVNSLIKKTKYKMFCFNSNILILL